MNLFMVAQKQDSEWINVFPSRDYSVNLSSSSKPFWTGLFPSKTKVATYSEDASSYICGLLVSLGAFLSLKQRKRKKLKQEQ